MWQDIRFAWRLAIRQPGVACLAVLTLTFGIAASTGIFTIADRALVQPLPYPARDRLVVLDRFAVVIHRGPEGIAIQPPEVKTRGEFEALGLYESGGLDWAGSSEPVRLRAVAADAGFFSVLGVRPLLGQTFGPEHDRGARVVLVSFNAWRRYFARDPSIVGRTIRLSEQAFTVIGVMPHLFAFPDDADVWVPPGADQRMSGAGIRARVVGRLADGVSIPQATEVLANLKDAAFGERQAGPPPSMTPLQDHLVSGVRPTLVFLVALVTLLLAASCASVASLLLSRLTLRAQELRVRAALGAGRLRLARQVLTESLCLGIVAAASGVPAGFWLVRTFSAVMPTFAPGVDLSGVDPRVLAIGIGVSVLSSLVFSLGPLMTFGRGRDDGLARAHVIATSRWRGLSSGLLISQMAVALILLAATSTALALVIRLSRIEFGVRNQAAVTFEVTLPGATYAGPGAVRDFVERLEAQLRAMPGVRAVGVTDLVPGSEGSKYIANLRLAGHRTGARAAEEHHSTMLVATRDYFRAMGVPLLAGRFFDAGDDGRPVVILNETAARAFDPDITRVVGERLVSPAAEIVGIVGDIRLDVDPAPAVVALRLGAVYQPLSRNPPRGTVAVALDQRGDLAAAVATARRGLREVDPNLAIYNISRVGDLPARLFASERLMLTLAALFAVVVLGLAATGLYGVLAQLVTQRTREIGIRIALGADPRRLSAGVVWTALRFAFAGMAVGACIAVAGWRLVSAAVPNLGAPNVPTLGGSALVLLVVTLVASWIPARRASTIDPATALRSD